MDQVSLNCGKPTVRVCIHDKCFLRGSKRVAEALRTSCGGEMDISETDDCFRFCKEGPNVAVDGAVLHGVRPSDAASRVRSEVRSPSKKLDAVGTRPLDELDALLDDLTP